MILLAVMKKIEIKKSCSLIRHIMNAKLGLGKEVACQR